jgi:hypothetical protein
MECWWGKKYSPLPRPRPGCENSNKVYLKVMWLWCGLDLCGPGLWQIAGPFVHDDNHLISAKCWEFLEQIKKYCLFKEESYPLC